MLMMPRKFNAGDNYGRITITKSYTEKKGRHWFHDCICECGNKTKLNGSELKRGRVKSCGCLFTETKTTHSMSSDPIYRVWASMIQRCANKKFTTYVNYGARGISVCDRWLKFVNFYNDMGDRPSPIHCIDRIDNDGNYEPQNCRWTTVAENNINQRVRKDNKFNKVGVSYRSDTGEFVATLQRNGERKYLGAFKTIEDAKNARLMAENNFKKENKK